LERLALHNQMELHMVRPQKNISAEDNQCLPIKIRITGRYFGLLKFLQGLQDGERLAVVKNLSIVSKGDTLESDMLIHIYAVPAK
jgi:Tfp pilus assembly protein PilO